MEKIWFKNYEPGVRHEVDTNEFASIPDVFRQAVGQFRDRPAMANMDKVLSYGELDVLSREFGSYLQNTLRLARGSRVAVMMPNLLQYPVAVFGILRAGYTVVNVNPLYTPRELEHQLKDAGADAIVIVENFASVLEQVIRRTPVTQVIVTGVGDLLGFPKRTIVNFVLRKVKKMVPPYRLPGHIRFLDALAAGRQASCEDAALTHDDIAFLQYTGGTTGVSKGAMLTHGNIVANMQQAAEWVKNQVRPGQEIIVTALPLYHIFSLTANLMVFTRSGALNILITNPRDIPGFIKEMGKYKVTAMTGVNTLFNALVNHPDFSRLDFSSWRVVLGGGMAVQKAVADKWKQVTGIPLIEAYGLTETSPAACINPLTLPAYNGCIGLPVPSTDIQIRDLEGRADPDLQQHPGDLRRPDRRPGHSVAAGAGPVVWQKAPG